jgi:type II secretory pathway component PulC
MMFQRRFSDVVKRQLDVFAIDESSGLLAEVHEMKRKYDRAERQSAEEAYGDYVDIVDAVKEALADMRNRFAQTLDGDAVEEYEAAFERAARRRWRWLG